MPRIAQITDCHLGPSPSTLLNGVNPQARLEDVLDDVSNWQPDLVVATGDLADRGRQEAYERLRGLLGGLDCPVLVVPGNHDDRAIMARHLCAGNVHCTSRHSIDDWNLVLLDSAVRGKPHGRVGESELQALRSDLNKRAAMVFVHHHPLPIGSAWLDAMMLENGDELLAALPTPVKAVFFGHVHQNFFSSHGSVAVLGTASTCYQIKPAMAQFALAEEDAPVYRRILLGADGSWQTSVHRVQKDRALKADGVPC